MSKLPVKNAQGESRGEYELSDDLLIYDKGRQSMQYAVTAHLANKRAGTASTLTKAEVAGSRAKPWKQKGSGRARAGYRQSPIWRGGGVAFGPRPRDYTKKVTKKEGRLAFRRAFSEKVAAGQVILVDDLGITEPRTRTFAALLTKLELGKALFITEGTDIKVRLASRNIQGVEIATAKDVNTYQLLRYPSVVITQSAMTRLEERLQSRQGRKG